MKRFISIILAAAVVLVSAAAVLADGTAYTLTVNGADIDLSDLPRAIYESDGHIMIPLRKTAEALGYRVEWDAETYLDKGYCPIYALSVTVWSGTRRRGTSRLTTTTYKAHISTAERQKQCSRDILR